MAEAPVHLDLRQARLAWASRQGLDAQRFAGAPLASVVSAVGWVPLATGNAGYIALQARGALSTRAALDAAVFTAEELTVVPGPRGLLWLVPAAEAPLARAFAVADHAAREARVASAVPLTARELQVTRDALRDLLARPVEPRALRSALPVEALRSLGPVGRRLGCSTVAGLVLHAMWSEGEVRRVPEAPRLDRDGFRYAIDPKRRPVPAAADAVDLVAPRWLAAHAPASARAFAAAFGIATGRAVSALRPLRPQRVVVEGIAEELLAPADFTPPLHPLPDAREAYGVLLPARDPLTDAVPDLAGLCDEVMAREVTVRPLGPGPVALVDGEVVGRWYWDPAGARVALSAPRADESALRALSPALERLSQFFLHELAPPAPPIGRPARAPARLVTELGAEL